MRSWWIVQRLSRKWFQKKKNAQPGSQWCSGPVTSTWTWSERFRIVGRPTLHSKEGKTHWRIEERLKSPFNVHTDSTAIPRKTVTQSPQSTERDVQMEAQSTVIDLPQNGHIAVWASPQCTKKLWASKERSGDGEVADYTEGETSILTSCTMALRSYITLLNY